MVALTQIGTTTMARPKAVRMVDGIVLAEHLYPDNKGRPNHFRYLRPDGTFKHFSSKSVEDANARAEKANANRHTFIPGVTTKVRDRDTLTYWVEQFIEYRERIDPKLTNKASWRNRCYALKSFGKEFSSKPLRYLTRDMIVEWWETLSRNQQKLRHAEFRKLYNWLMGKKLCPKLDYNPFTTTDDLPRLMLSGADEKARMRIENIDQFWAIYDTAGKLKYEALQIAMGISLTTFMREGDICGLRIDKNLRDNLLRKVIGKSYEQKGSARAARLSWNQTNYELLRQLIARGMELAIKNHGCPFLISHKPKQWKRQERNLAKFRTKEHFCQVTPRRLGEMFAEARIEAKIHLDLPKGKSPCTFHEVRSFASKLALDAGYDIKDVQKAMAHEDESTTMIYLDEHTLPYDQAPVMFTKDLLGRDFA